MNLIKENLPVAMILNDLAQAPVHSLPEGYSLRFYQPGDETAWVDIHKEADRWNEMDLQRFEDVFSEHPLSLQERQFYLLNSKDEPIGTATAWERELNGCLLGLVHWVAIHPGYQGRGLAKPLLSATLSRLNEVGHVGAFLKTSTARFAAINLYWKFGFRPLRVQDKDAEIWNRVRVELRSNR